ncbi:contact-dependent growth inhibition system immunity protein [Puniceicoccaceae bacterium K14]|nr:contact-dependent growth inhibition system immunity protein [Puniceicoccaceae bacterium K14]
MAELKPEDRKILFQFFGGYFHQDIMLDHENYESIISEYILISSKSEKINLLEAMQRLHDSKIGEKKIERIICDEFGASVWPVKLRGRQWLAEMIGRLRTIEK